MIKLKLKDGSIKEIKDGKSVYEVAKEISEGLARNATCASVNGKVVDLRYINMNLLSNYINFDNQDILILYNTSIINSSDMLKIF